LAGWLSASSGLHAQSANAWGVGSTNLDRLPHFWAAVERSNAPVTVVAFGDSVAVQYQSIQFFLFSRLQASHGDAGYAYVDTYNRIAASLGGGASWLGSKTTANPLWWSDYLRLPPGGYVSWADSWTSAGPVACDQVGVFWIAHPGGGAFALSVATNRGVWNAPLVVLDGYSPQPVGRHTNTTLAQASYWLRAESVSGTNLILSPQFLKRTSTGIQTAYLAKVNANLNEILSLSTNLTYPILSALNPQLVVWHAKEVADIGATGLSNRLFGQEAMWRNCVTNGDVVYIGTPYDFRDTNNPVWTPTQNRLVKQAAERDGHGYLDSMTPCVSYPAMVAANFTPDGIHVNNTGNAYLAGIAWRELTWSALRLDRWLTLQSLPGGAQVLSWPSGTNLSYTLQAATDLQNWSPIHTALGDGTRHAVTNVPSASGHQMFRLKLTGN
jgi:hypothetical protein